MDSASKERRGSPRRRVLKGSIILFNDRHSTLPCTVRDLSATGARVRVESSVTAPDAFILLIELDGFEDTSREQCLLMTGYFRGSIRLAGHDNPEVTKLSCRLWGDALCAWRATWKDD